MYITIMTQWKIHMDNALIAMLASHDWKWLAKSIKDIEQGKEYLSKKLYPKILNQWHE